MTTDMTTYRAYLACRSCAESLLIAHHAGHNDARWHTKYALEEAQKMAALLGYDLVKRETKQEAA